MKGIFGLVIYGLTNPYDTATTTATLYTDGDLPTAGRPTELVGAPILPIVHQRPGIHWGADPRSPVGSDGEVTVTLIDDEEGKLGQLFLNDPDSYTWGVEANRLSDVATAISVVGLPLLTVADETTVHYLGNEAVVFSLGAQTSQGQNLTLVRGQCGSAARVHTLRPTDYSPGEDGTQDRILLKQKPDWDEGFLCGLYLFTLDELGAISGYILRRGVVIGEPRDEERPFFDVDIRLLEDHLSSHKVGETSKETTLGFRIIATEIEGTSADKLYPNKALILLSLAQAEAFFNEPLGARGSGIIDVSMVTDLNTRMTADPEVTYEVKVDDGDQWIFLITNVGTYDYNANGVAHKAIKLSGTLLRPDGISDGATIGGG